MRLIIYFLLTLLTASCISDKHERRIDLKSSEQIAKYMDELGIIRLIRVDNNLIINDTLVVFDSSKHGALRHSQGFKVQLEIDQFLRHWKRDREALMVLRKLMKESGNTRITRVRKSYFFVEGGWIDSQVGKVYSRAEISDIEMDMRSMYNSERTRELNPVENQLDWYDYYID